MTDLFVFNMSRSYTPILSYKVFPKLLEMITQFFHKKMQSLYFDKLGPPERRP